MTQWLLTHDRRGRVGYVDDDPFECAYRGPDDEVATVVDEAAMLVDTATRPGPGLNMNTGPREDDPAEPLSNARKATKMAAELDREIDALDVEQIDDRDVAGAVDAPVVVRHDVDRFDDATKYVEVKARELAAELPESVDQLRQTIRERAREYGTLRAPVTEIRANRDVWPFVLRGPDEPTYLQD